MPTFGSLFAGIGGIDLGLERAGWTGRWQVEWDEWCRARLTDRWPDVPKYGDIADVDWSGVGRVDLLAGGFPCQPVSVAGRQAAQEDARWLWPEFHRAIRDLRPRLVLVENVPNLLAVGDGSAFGDVLGDLAASGYDTEWDCIPAAAVGAPHERDRVFLVAYPDGHELRDEPGRGRGSGRQGASVTGDDGTDGPVADPDASRWRARKRNDDARQSDTARSRPSVAYAHRLDGDDGGHGTGAVREDGPEPTDLRRRSLADADGSRLEGRVFQPERAREWFARPSRVADPASGRRQRRRSEPGGARRPLDLSAGPGQGDARGRQLEPGLGRAPDGLPSGLDHCWPAPPGLQYEWEPTRTVVGRVPDRTRRLKACGNAVVPQVVEVIGRRLLEIA